MIADITIANKLNRKDSTTGLDVWYKTIIKDVKYKIDKITNVNGTEVSIGQQFIILIPFSEKFKNYNEWKQDSNNKNSTYTMSQGDYIFLTDVPEDITPNNIIALRNQYKPNVCEVRSIEEVPIENKKYGVKVQLRISGV